MGIGIRMKEILRDKNMTIKQLAENSGVSINTLYSISKRDSERVDEIILRRIANALGVHLLDLIGANEELNKYHVEVKLPHGKTLEFQDIEKIYDSLSDKEKSEFFEAVYSGVTKKAPTPEGERELTDAVIFGRDGRMVKRTYSKEQMETVYKLLDAIPHKDEDI